MRTSLYPLRGLPHQGQLWAWISYDVANQSFTLLINTLLFPLFFQQVVIKSQGDEKTLWSVTYAVSMLLTVVASPIAGAVADERAWKKEALVVTGFGCAALTCLFGLIPAGGFWLAAALYVPANFAFSIGENFLASFLPELARREDFGRVSGFSWGVAYASALVILIITGIAMKVFGLGAIDQWRPFFVFAGLWFFAFAIPTLLFLRERPAAGARHGVNVWTVGFVRLGESVRNIRQYRDLMTLLIASLLYGTGMSVVIMFASTIASDFGFGQEKLVAFVAVITLSGVIGTLLPTLYQDRIGHRRMTVILLAVWVVTTLGLAGFAFARRQSADPAGFVQWPLWVFGNLIGFGLGSLGAANRAFVGYLTPPSKTAEVFGLWGMVFKLAAVCTIPFATVYDRMGAAPALLVLAGFLIAGLAITMLVDEARGTLAAKEG